MIVFFSSSKVQITIVFRKESSSKLRNILALHKSFSPELFVKKKIKMKIKEFEICCL